MNKTEKISNWLDRGGVVSYGALHLVDSCVYTYDVLIGRVSREERTATVCTKTYTQTSSTHRNRLLEALISRNYTITKVDDSLVI